MSSPLDQARDACAKPLDHPPPDWLRAAGNQVVDFVLSDFTRLGVQPVGRFETRQAMEELLREPPPEHGQAFEQVLAEFQQKVAEHAFRAHHPRFLAFIPGAPSYISILGDWLADGMNFFAGVWKEAAGPAEVELIVLDWFKTFLGYPDAAAGLLTGGGSEATLTALVVARERLSHDERHRAVLYASDQRHWSFDRGAMIAGFRPEQVRALPADANQRLSPQRLEEAIAEDRRAGRSPFFVLASAGTTNTGSVDPLEALADVCRSNGLWLHADAAYGWAAILTDEGRSLLRGIERADSITLDPHKWFGQTFDAGCLLVREGERLEATFSMRPEYMQDVQPQKGEVNFADRGIALTRRFRALKIWLSLKVLGVGWFRQLVIHCCRLADFARLALEAAGFEILRAPELGILCFRFVPREASARAADLDALNLAICDDVNRSGRFFLSTTRLGGTVALRLCFVNWRTKARDIEDLVQTLKETGERLAT